MKVLFRIFMILLVFGLIVLYFFSYFLPISIKAIDKKVIEKTLQHAKKGKPLICYEDLSIILIEKPKVIGNRLVVETKENRPVFFAYLSNCKPYYIIGQQKTEGNVTNTKL